VSYWDAVLCGSGNHGSIKISAPPQMLRFSNNGLEIFDSVKTKEETMNKFTLFVSAAENGYIVSDRLSNDQNTKNYVASDEKELAELVKKLALEAKQKDPCEACKAKK